MLSKEDFLRRKEMWDQVLESVRTFFLSRDFLEVKTPLLVPSPGMEPNLKPFEVEIKSPNQKQNQNSNSSVKAGLITSPEYSMKKLVGIGLEKIFTITPTFRNFEGGKLNTPEFTMLEWYAPGGYEDLMKETEDLLKFVLSDQTNWPHLTHIRADVDQYGDPHVDEERFFITHYPKEQAALANLTSDGEFAERFEAFADGMELCNGFSELIDPVEQRLRFETEQKERRAVGETIFPIDEELLAALARIETPIYGNALGMDRLVMLVNGIKDINEVQMFTDVF